MEYYLGRFDFIAKGLEKDILRQNNERYNRGLKEIKISDDISCYGVEKGDEIYLLIRKDKHIVWIRYHRGTATMEEIIEKTLEKLD